MNQTAKIAVSMPGSLLRELEALRSETGETRSSVVQRALRHLVEERRRADRICRYQKGYRAAPEDAAEVAAAMASAGPLLAGEPWR